ncbi:hypothetical protein OSB04_019603 [Centaurea solstitialis]|uniref:ATP-dependent DNA helicase n=1 Tax=Centaurea solstitialis TaxID=347529 RepID=A0AA38T2X4_9ASTR|nr:hypothetical protein OSB04_019603 [Centaurea solstitialis]
MSASKLLSFVFVIEKTREYNREYYARRKAIKKRQIQANGGGSSQSTMATDVERDIAERRRNYNRNYYLRRKEKNMMGKGINACVGGSTEAILNSSNRNYMLQEDPYDYIYNRIPKEHRILKEQLPCNDNITVYKRSIIVYGRSDYSQEIQAHFGSYDPLAYPLFFPNGESGWHSKILRHGVSINEVVGVDEIMEEDSEGGPRDMRRRFLDAIALVQDDGKPDIFLTMTCNPKWPEILKELLPGQTAADRPDLVARIFRAKLEDLNDHLFQKNILGIVIAYVYVIEFQKCGFPHAHFLLIMRAEDKMVNPDHYNKIVCAEIPDPTKYPEMHQLVVQHMMHGPCGNVRPSSPCMQGEPKRCHFRYLRVFNDKTSNAENSYPLYRRRDLGREVNVRGNTLDNRWVVPYTQNVRYVSPPEAMWRIFSFALSQIHPYVMTLQLHLPNKQMVRFREDDVMVDIVARERDKRRMLTAFFDKNKEDESARRHLYKDFPKHCTWNASSRRWNPRIQGLMVGRLVSANPAEGERYYLHVLLSHISGPTSFEDLYTVNGILHPTFQKAALERGLIETDDNLSQCLAEASLFQFPNALRRLFATILTYCEPGDVRKLWDEHYESLSEGYRRQCESVDRVQNMVLTDIANFLQSMGKNLDDFDLPKIYANANLQIGSFCDVQEEYSIMVEDEHLRARDALYLDQKYAYDEIMKHLDDDRLGVFFIDGLGGTDKTVLYKALLANIRSHGLIALATASSGVAANNMPRGRTAHSRFKIPLNLDNNSMCNIKKQMGDGVEEATEESFIRIPDDIAIAYTDKARSKNDLIDAIFPSLEINGADSDYIISRAILSTKNETVDEINDQLIDRFCGDEKVYYNFDEVEDDRNNFYPMEFLNAI